MVEQTECGGKRRKTADILSDPTRRSHKARRPADAPVRARKANGGEKPGRARKVNGVKMEEDFKHSGKKAQSDDEDSASDSDSEIENQIRMPMHKMNVRMHAHTPTAQCAAEQAQ